MKAKECDRCGALYKPKDKIQYGLYVFSGAKKGYRRSADLCPECEDELGKWYNKMVIRGGTKHD